MESMNPNSPEKTTPGSISRTPDYTALDPDLIQTPKFLKSVMCMSPSCPQQSGGVPRIELRAHSLVLGTLRYIPC